MLKYPAFIIILCAGFGFFVTYLMLRANIAQNPVEEIEILVAQDTSKMNIIYDTIRAKSKFYKFPPKTVAKSGKPDESNKHKIEYKALIFNQNSKYLVWMLVFSLMSGYACAFLPILWHRVKGDFKHMRLKARELIVALIVCLMVLFALIIGSGDSDNLLSILDVNVLIKALFQNEWC